MLVKHYNRALRILKLTVEALERLLFEVFERSLEGRDKLDDEADIRLERLSENPHNEHLHTYRAS